MTTEVFSFGQRVAHIDGRHGAVLEHDQGTVCRVLWDDGRTGFASCCDLATLWKAGVRRFDTADWHVFSGAEAFGDGSAPLIGESERDIVVGDRSGIQVLTSAPAYVWVKPMAGVGQETIHQLVRFLWALSQQGSLSSELLFQLGFTVMGRI